jgi:hypothetical protein
MKMYLTVLLFLTFLVGSMHAQEAVVTTEVDSTGFLIGEWITLHVRVDAPKTWTVRLPSQDEDFSNAEFISTEATAAEMSGERQSLRQDFIITVFDTGSIPITTRIRYNVPGDTATYELFSDALTLKIATVDLDTTMTFKDIRNVLHVSLTIWDYLLYAAVVLLIALVAWFGYRWYKRRHETSDEPDVVPEPDIPPHVLALQELERIRTEQLWQNGKHKSYQSRVTDVLRGYIERRFRVQALEHPTSEIIPDIAMLGLQPPLVSGLERVLSTADMTKFAKYIPNVAEHEEAMRFSVAFVEDTRPAAEKMNPLQSDATDSDTEAGNGEGSHV